MTAEQFAEALVRSGWDIAPTEGGGFRVCTFPAAHPIDAVRGAMPSRTGFCDGLFASVAASNEGFMSRVDAEIVRFACGTATDEYNLIRAGAPREWWGRIRDVRAQLERHSRKGAK